MTQTAERTYSISDLLAAHKDGRVTLAPEAATKHQSGEEWYDDYGWHLSTERHGDICLQEVEYDWLDDGDDAAVAALLVAGLPDPCDEEDAEDLQSCAEGVVARAREIREAADSVESLLDAAVAAYEAGDVDATVKALCEASSEEDEHGDDPATQTLIHALCLIRTEDEE